MSKQSARPIEKEGEIEEKRGRGHGGVARSALVPQKHVLLSIAIKQKKVISLQLGE